MEALAYFSLKAEFKQRFLVQGIQNVCKHVKKQTYQAFVFMVLNMCRDEKFDLIPSFGLKNEQRKSDEHLDLTYWQMKELRNQLPKASLMTMEFANCYGSDMQGVRKMVCESDVLELLRNKECIKAAGVLQM